METWDRPSRSMESRTDRIRTELGNLYLACRLLSLHLRRGTPIEEIVEQCRGIRDMAPTPNVQNDGTVVWNTGVGDAIAQVLQEFVIHSGSDD